MKPQKSPADHADLRRRTTNHKTALTSPTCLSLRNNAALLHSSLRYLRYLRENIHMRVLNLYCSNETPEVSRRSRWFTQTNNKTAITTKHNYNRMNLTINPNCLSLRDNAACCIPLRDLRNLRENNTQAYSIYIAQMKTQKSPADLADNRRQTTKHQNPKTSKHQTTRTHARIAFQ